MARGEIADDEAADRQALRKHLCASAPAAGSGRRTVAVALYCAISPQTGMRANAFSSGKTASNTAPPTFSK